MHLLLCREVLQRGARGLLGGVAQDRVDVVIHLIHQCPQINILTQAGADLLNLIKAVVAAVDILASYLGRVIQIWAVPWEQRDILTALL